MEVRAPDPRTLFETAGEALCALLVEPGAIAPSEQRRIAVVGADREELLVRWLSEILFLHEAEAFLATGFHVETMENDRLEGIVMGERYDPVRHRILAQIKAVTYHQVRVAQEEDGWVARVILDV